MARRRVRRRNRRGRRPAPPRISGQDYSVYSPLKVRLGLRLWARMRAPGSGPVGE